MLAKSDGLSLNQHTQDLLDVMREFQNAFPIFGTLIGDHDFWTYLKTAIIFHDTGKATVGFQNLMTNQKQYRFRHELLSAIVVQNYSREELIVNAILAHHKSYKKLNELLNEYENNIKYNQGLWIEKEFGNLDLFWLESFLRSHKIIVDKFELFNLRSCIKKWISKRKKQNITEIEKFNNIFLSASLSICDHNASAGIKQIPIIEKKHFSFLHNSKFKPYYHQIVSWKTKGNALLIAPTGQGKTESSLGWLENQLTVRQGRAFYILPFTASINAMAKRVSEAKDGFGDEALVGLLHGKAKFFIDEYYEKKDGQSLKELTDINRKIVKPFKVVTPFQILKWAFGVKGFEKGFTELAGSYLIFDEIHIYDGELFKRILFFIEWLIEKLEVQVFIMTATMPSFMQQHIKMTLKIKEEIRPDAELIKGIQRHKVKLLDSTIERQKNFIQSKIDCGKMVLIVCNTVAKSQLMYELIECSDKNLLHSGFNSRDRIDKEKRVQSLNKPQLLVGTQAIEVSLDIDYDLIISEPAPFDALLQRFGRVYRKKNRVLNINDEANCFVTTEIEDAHKMIYQANLIQSTLEELKKIENTIINENDIQNILNNIYDPFDLESDNLRTELRKYLDNLYPFNVYEENEEDFFSQFDGIEALPIELYDDFVNYVDQKQYIEAEKLFISMSKNKFIKMLRENRVSRVELDGFHQKILIIDSKYNSNLGVNFYEKSERSL
jgi:CRISPR-associated endonuclease/helicase Cas3